MEEKVLQSVYAYIDANKENILKELKDICSIRSVSDATSEVKPFGQGCLDALNCMLKKGERDHFETHNYDNYVGGICLNQNCEDTVGIWAHLDVVPEQDGWMSDPYQPVERDGFLFGRGVGDNKSAAIGAFYILKAIRELQIPLKHNVQLFLGTSEETGMADVSYYVDHYPVPKFSFVPDAGFPGACGEFGRVRYALVSRKKLSKQVIELEAGSVFNIIPNYAYIVLEDNGQVDTSGIPQDGYSVSKENGLVKIEAYGLSKHAAGPDDAINAIYQLTKVLCDLPGLCESDQEIFRFLTNVNASCYGDFFGINKTDEISGQTVSSGTVLRLQDGIVRLLNDCRHCVSDSNDDVLEKVKRVSNAHGFDVEVISLSKPYYIDKQGEIVQTMTRIYREHTQDTREMAIMKGGTYAGHIPNAVATGICFVKDLVVPPYIKPGHGGAHQPDEMLPIAGYIEGIKLFAKILLEVDEIL